MAITFRAVGANGATNGGSAPTATLPAGLAAGDLMLTLFYSRANVVGTVSISSGWTQIVNDRTSGGLLALWWRAWQSGDAAPTFTLGGHVGGSTGDATVCQVAAWSGCNTTTPVATTGTISTNASQQNIGAISGITLDADDMVLVVGGKRDDFGSGAQVPTLSGDGLTWAEADEPDTTNGADAGAVWDYAINGGSQVTVTSKTFVPASGAAAEGKGVMVAINVAGAAEVVRPSITVAPSVAASQSYTR